MRERREKEKKIRIKKGAPIPKGREIPPSESLSYSRLSLNFLVFHQEFVKEESREKEGIEVRREKKELRENNFRCSILFFGQFLLNKQTVNNSRSFYLIQWQKLN